jgi:TPR repeat protein
VNSIATDKAAKTSIDVEKSSLQIDPRALKGVQLIEEQSSPIEGIKLLISASNDGDVYASYILGQMYFYGKIIPKNYEVAYKFLSTVNGRYRLSAQISIVVILARGFGSVEPNYSKAKELALEIKKELTKLNDNRPGGRPTSVESVESGLQLYLDNALLMAYADELGISLE